MDTLHRKNAVKKTESEIQENTGKYDEMNG